MAVKREKVYVERENEEGKKLNWRNAWLELDRAAGTVTLQSVGALAKKWTITFAANQVSAFEIIQISDVNTLATMYGGGLLGWGIAKLMSTWVKVPAIGLTQQVAAPGQQWANFRAPGIQPKRTHDLAFQIEAMLRERGYSGMMPDLHDEEVWKNPAGKILIGCGVTIVVVICLFVVIWVAAEFFS